MSKKKEGTKYKFIVGSAEEAVKVLRERLGENAQVLSVRQVEGAGLARFLRAPRLEVIAQAAPDEEDELPPPPKRAKAAPKVEKETPPPKGEVSQPPRNKEEDDIDSDEASIHAVLDSAPPLVKPSVSRSAAAFAANNAKVETPPPTPKGSDLVRVLQKGGIPESLLARFQTLEVWPRIEKQPLGEGLKEAAALLRREFDALPKVPVNRSIAFLGTPGVGKTTALCKRLAMEVFLHQRRAVVLKVDMETANSGEGLATFCEALGVPMVRSLDSVPRLSPEDVLYIDFPGITPQGIEEQESLAKLLTSMSIASRALVINAAYDTSLIKQAYSMGTRLGATHVVFSHLDELSQWGKLWEYLLVGGLCPLFLSSGQNIAGDFSENIIDTILEHSFPAIGKENALHST